MRNFIVPIVLLLSLVGCLAPADTASDPTPAAAPAASSWSDTVQPVSSPAADPHSGGCGIAFCDSFVPCPICLGKPGVCGANGLCSYPNIGGGGGGGGTGCVQRVCGDVSECAAACPQSANPQCIAGVCRY